MTQPVPGDTLPLRQGAVCDKHPRRLAVKRICTEADSFGIETTNLCQACHESYLRKIQQHHSGNATDICDWCHGEYPASQVKPHRDFEEGSSGPVYQVCQQCRVAEAARVALELGDDYDHY